MCFCVTFITHLLILLSAIVCFLGQAISIEDTILTDLLGLHKVEEIHGIVHRAVLKLGT